VHPVIITILHETRDFARVPFESAYGVMEMMKQPKRIVVELHRFETFDPIDRRFRVWPWISHWSR
jgi:hypothetical protein